ncbi:MAG: SGNH/GDSL hydrolase family protein [Spirochaetia bacterium]|jgi:lysophospholipase L1-like esterase
MIEVLCYGDSNTYGFMPGGGGRYPSHMRWTGVMQKALGGSCHVIEEGLNGRTTAWDDPVEGAYRNGTPYLLPCLLSHAPLDLVLLFLGVNDLKKRFDLPAADIARSAGSLVDIIRQSGAGPSGAAPAVLLIAPAPLGKLSGYAEMLEGGTEKSRQLAALYAQTARQLGCAFIDAGSLVRSSDIDGVHLEEKEHRILGEALALQVRKLTS